MKNFVEGQSMDVSEKKDIESTVRIDGVTLSIKKLAAWVTGCNDCGDTSGCSNCSTCS